MSGSVLTIVIVLMLMVVALADAIARAGIKHNEIVTLKADCELHELEARARAIHARHADER